MTTNTDKSFYYYVHRGPLSEALEEPTANGFFYEEDNEVLHYMITQTGAAMQSSTGEEWRHVTKETMDKVLYECKRCVMMGTEPRMEGFKPNHEMMSKVMQSFPVIFERDEDATDFRLSKVAPDQIGPKSSKAP